MGVHILTKEIIIIKNVIPEVGRQFFRLSIKLSISNGMGFAVRKFENVCLLIHWTELPDPNLRRRDNKDWLKRAVAKLTWNRVRHLYLFLTRLCQWGPLYFKAQNRKFGISPGGRNIFIEPKIAVRPHEKHNLLQ